MSGNQIQEAQQMPAWYAEVTFADRGIAQTLQDCSFVPSCYLV